MDVSHLLVGVLTAIFISLLVWIEIRSRRNTALQEEIPEPAEVAAVRTPPKKKRR